MSSSLIDDLPIGGSAAPAGDGEAEGEFFGDPEIRPRGWIKRLLPRTMFGRSLLIVVMPLILLQAIATWIFYDRHWTAISWRLSTGVAGDIGLMIEAIELTGSDAAATRLLKHGGLVTDLDSPSIAARTCRRRCRPEAP